MAGVPPTPDFANVDLVIAPIDVGKTFGRIHRKTFPEPLGYGKNATRFSDPRRRKPENRFGVLYLGASLKVCFVETILRDRRDGLVGEIEIEESELSDRYYSQISAREPLRLINLNDDGLVQMGIPTDVARGRSQTLARKWSLAIYEHPAAIDGILYPSRLNNETNMAIYDRATSKLSEVRTCDLDKAPGIGPVLDRFQVAFMDSTS
ncbi:MAG: RES family NAD+ phosphorylase [Sphingopyxis sp.]|nr:RES family NAD+ phosphorylase [Sphingopyxis sp.]